MEQSKVLYRIILAIIILGIIVTFSGVFYSTGGQPFNTTNQYGDTIKIYGDGVYAHDSFFKAPIFRGTDFSILFIAIPLLIISLVIDMKRNSLKSRLFLTSVLSIFTYYSFSIAFGVTYNFLLLPYIALFSSSFFGLIIAIRSINKNDLVKSIAKPLPYRGFYVFLIITGIALIAAWLPDILSALFANRALALIEVYTTEITYAFDMGIIAPVAFICIGLLKKRSGLGFVLLEIMLTLSIFIGILTPIQSVFQLSAGIDLPLPALISKAASFCALALFALYLNIKLIKAINTNR